MRGSRLLGSRSGVAVKRRTTHVVDALPERVCLISAPGSLRGQVVEVDGWRHVEGELRVRCRTTDGARVLLPAAWTDLPRNVPEETPLEELLATPDAWRRFTKIAGGLRGRRPPRAQGCFRNSGGGDAGSAGVDGRRGVDGGRGRVGDAARGGQDASLPRRSAWVMSA
jgi:hypothetical protein